MRSGAVVLGLIAGFGTVGMFGGCWASAPASECETFAAQLDTCAIGFTDDLTLTGTLRYDTAAHELRVAGAAVPATYMTVTAEAGAVDALVVHDVRIGEGARLWGTGALPFAIIASGSVTLEDGVDRREQRRSWRADVVPEPGAAGQRQ